jgi:peptidoglycan/LPS O-acetylase OafA/YrhL
MRIFPAYYVFVMFSIALDAVRGHAWSSGLIASSALYVMNYYNAFQGHPSTPVAHAWSLAIEEQFYLLWPILFLTFIRKGIGVLRAVGVSVIVAVVAWRSLLFLKVGVGSAYVYNAFDTRFDNILVGCLIAVCIEQEWLRRLAGAAVRWAALPLATLGLLACSRILGPSTYHYTLGFTVDALLLGLFMIQVLQLFSHPLWSWLEHPVMRYVGTISYPLYLYHQVGLGVARRLDIVPVAGQFAAGLGAAVALASASYHCVERPFLALKQRYAAVPGRGVPLPDDPDSRRGRWRSWRASSGKAADVGLGRHDVIEQDGAAVAYRIGGGVVLEPNPVDIEVRVASPAKPFERGAAGVLREVPPAP